MKLISLETKEKIKKELYGYIVSIELDINRLKKEIEEKEELIKDYQDEIDNL